MRSPRHAGESRHPEPLEKTGFRVKPGMTEEQVRLVFRHPLFPESAPNRSRGSRDRNPATSGFIPNDQAGGCRRELANMGADPLPSVQDG